MKALVFLLGLLHVAPAFSQPSDEFDLQRFSDDLLGYQEADADYEDIYENLMQILSSPYDLNKVSADELKLLHILNDTQIENFITYRNEQGTLLDVYELQAIPEFDLPLISKLKPFVRVVDPQARAGRPLVQRILSTGNSYFISRYERTLENRKGFMQTPGKPPPYSGSPDKLYVRFRSALSGDFSIGLTGEKDPGEKIAFEPTRHTWGFDFTSYHFQLQKKGIIKNLIAGDFQSQFGQGLILGGAFGLGKGGETVLSVRKSNAGFLPYTSINESAYQRGAGLTVQLLKNLSFSAFYSRAGRDAAADSAYIVTVSSFQTSGYHRTENELKNRKRVMEENCGLILQWKKNSLDAGLILDAIHFDIPVGKTSTLFNQYAFRGSRNISTSLFVNYRMGNVSFFSEAAQSLNAGTGIILGLLMNPHRNLDVAMVYRNYDRDFYTFYSNAFSENTQPQNERGVYWGWKYRWSRQFNVTGYADLFSFPWLSFRRYAPSHGYEWLMRGNYTPSENVSLFIQFREESKERNLPATTSLYLLGKGLKRNVALNCDYGPGGKIRLKSRIQYSSYFFNKIISRGFTLVQDFSFSAGPFRFTGRQALFDADNFDNRQYVYENDAWLAFSFPSYSGVGVRNYALIEYKVHKNITLWVRFARTRLLNADQIGSGQDVIEGNTKNDVKFQARLKF